MLYSAVLAVAFAVVPSAAHLTMWDPSLYGFNWTELNPNWGAAGGYDNRPVAPLIDRTYSDWWMHGLIDYPPNPGDYLDLVAGESIMTQIACDKGATTFYASSSGGDIQDGESVCPGQPTSQFHTTSIDDVMGSCLGIAYKSDITQVTEEDIVIFSCNYTSPWYRYTYYEVPADLPPCEDCICTWNWIHGPDSGSMQMYQTAYNCKVTNSGPGLPLQAPQLARRCGYDSINNVAADPANCTGGTGGGAKQALYWFQADGNNMFEGTYSPPLYNALYDFKDGAQPDIFQSGAVSVSTASSTSSTAAPSSTSSVAVTSPAASPTVAPAVPAASPDTVAAAAPSPVAAAAPSPDSTPDDDDGDDSDDNDSEPPATPAVDSDSPPAAAAPASGGTQTSTGSKCGVSPSYHRRHHGKRSKHHGHHCSWNS